MTFPVGIGGQKKRDVFSFSAEMALVHVLLPLVILCPSSLIHFYRYPYNAVL